EFGQLEGLFYYWADADEAGVFFGVAERNLVGERHLIFGLCSLGSFGEGLYVEVLRAYLSDALRMTTLWGAAASSRSEARPLQEYYPSFESFSRTRSLRALPSTALPVRASFAAF